MTRSRRSRPSCTSSCGRTGRPGRSATTGDHPNTGGCSRNPAVQDRGPGCPTADPAIRAAIAYAIDKNEINTRLLGGNAQVANTNISPSAWFYADQTPATFDPEKAKQILADGGWTDTNGDGIVEKNGLTAKIELCTTTRQVRQDTLALISAWLKNVGIDSVINPVDPSAIFADYNEATNDIPCALSRSNFDLAEHAFSSSIDPLGNYTSYHSSQFRPQGANDAQVNNPDVDKALQDVKTNVDFSVIRDAMASFQKAYVDQTVEVPLYYRKNVELAAPGARQLLRQRHPGRLDLERRGLVPQPVGRGFAEAFETGRPVAGRPVSTTSVDSRHGCTVRATPVRSGEPTGRLHEALAPG